MSFLLGSKALKRLVRDGDALQFVQAKLSEKLFIGDEIPIYKMVVNHLKEFHVLPAELTLLEAFPILTTLDVPEPADYYLKKVETRYGYTIVNAAAQAATKALKQNPDDVEGAVKLLNVASSDWATQKYRHKIMKFKEEGHDALTAGYFAPKGASTCEFGWPFLDKIAGGMGPGDVMSMVGRPASGKTYQGLHIGCHNVFNHKKTVLFVSMEMTPYVLAQRVSAIYSHLPITQIKTKQLASKSLNKWLAGLQSLASLDSAGELYIVDGNLAATVNDIYQLAGALGCHMVMIDGAYLLKHEDKRLDRFTRVAENVELLKARTTTLQIPTYAAWQFRKDDKTQTDKKTGAPVKKQKTIDDIGYSDAIAQISSVVLGLEQPETVETLVKRQVTLLKGRDGETGRFWTHWNFDIMDFSEVHETDEEKVAVLVNL